MPTSHVLRQRLAPVFTAIDDRKDEHLALLVDYVRRPSISAHGEGIREVAEYICDVITDVGVPARLVESNGYPFVFGERCDHPDAPTVLLYGHYDVQPPDPLDEWLSPPFEPTIRDRRIYARGVGDNKGQHLAQILGVGALLAQEGALPLNVKILLEGEEEIGSPQMKPFMEAHRDMLAADLVITSDGPVHESGKSTIHFGVRGVMSFELHATGANRDLHSGNWGGVAPNPIWSLVHVLATMKDRHGRVTVDGFYDGVEPFSQLEMDEVAKHPVDEDEIKRSIGLTDFDQPLDRSYAERLMVFPTLTINGFHGGYGGPGSKTVLPHQAVVKCDVRLVEAMTAEDIYEKLERHVKAVDSSIEFVRQGSMEPSRTPLDSPFTGPIRTALELVKGEPPLLVPAMGGSLPDYVFTKILGVPAFGVPYANADEANHAPNENMEVERFFDGIKTGAAMLVALGEMRLD